MTPSKRDKTTIIRIEKVKKAQVDEAQVAHKAGGQHSGLVINKQSAAEGNVKLSDRLEGECLGMSFRRIRMCDIRDVRHVRWTHKQIHSSSPAVIACVRIRSADAYCKSFILSAFAHASMLLVIGISKLAKL